MYVSPPLKMQLLGLTDKPGDLIVGQISECRGRDVVPIFRPFIPCSKYDWMNCTATDPSPTPEATRFYRTMPHIAYRKKAGNIRLEQIRISVEGHTPWDAAPLESGRASQDEAAFVALNYIREPLSSGQRSNKDDIALAGTRSSLLVSEQRIEISSRCISPCASATLRVPQTSMLVISLPGRSDTATWYWRENFLAPE